MIKEGSIVKVMGFPYNENFVIIAIDFQERKCWVCNITNSAGYVLVNLEAIYMPKPIKPKPISEIDFLNCFQSNFKEGV